MDRLKSLSGEKKATVDIQALGGALRKSPTKDSQDKMRNKLQAMIAPTARSRTISPRTKKTKGEEGAQQDEYAGPNFFVDASHNPESSSLD